MYFLYHLRSKPTGEVLASALGLPHGLAAEGPKDVLIRWGSRAAANVGTFDAWGRIINSGRAITLASDKLRSLEVMQEAGITVPPFSTDPETLTFPFLGRKRHHARGTDVTLCLQRRDYKRRPRDYYVQYIPTVREYRVHVAFGEVIRVQGKYADIPSSAATPWIRNYANGWRFRAPRNRLKRDRTDMAIKAVSALGLDFGAVDLLVGDDGQAYILEVNTAPACSPLTGAAYVRAFAAQLGISEPNYEALNVFSQDADDGDTEDEVEGEDDE